MNTWGESMGGGGVGYGWNNGRGRVVWVEQWEGESGMGGVSKAQG